MELKYEKAVRDLENSKKESDSRMQGTVKIIPTETRRSVLIDTITKAKREIVIVSPWTNGSWITNCTNILIMPSPKE